MRCAHLKINLGVRWTCTPKGSWRCECHLPRVFHWVWWIVEHRRLGNLVASVDQKPSMHPCDACFSWIHAGVIGGARPISSSLATYHRQRKTIKTRVDRSGMCYRLQSKKTLNPEEMFCNSCFHCFSLRSSISHTHTYIYNINTHVCNISMYLLSLPSYATRKYATKLRLKPKFVKALDIHPKAQPSIAAFGPSHWSKWILVILSSRAWEQKIQTTSIF